ncbi:MAG: hypothetical protein JEY96_19765 [Bacteroidales bacterium]|nr:hypothetical protein [Bacteroidales bacterium]
MRKLTILLLICVVFSCTDKKDIKGIWVEKDNFNSPEIIKFEDYLFYPVTATHQKHMYKLDNDTFITQRFGEIEKMKYKLSENSLEFFSIKTDTLLVAYEKASPSFIDYINEKFNLDIELINYSSKNLYPHFENKFLYLDRSSNNETILSYNGSEIPLDSLLYLTFLDTTDYMHRSSIYLFADKQVPVNDLNKLKIELRKAMQYRLFYITTVNQGELNGTYSKIPPIEFEYPVSFNKSFFPPLPPKLEYPSKAEFFKKAVLFEIQKDNVYLNDTLSSFGKFESTLRKKLELEEKPILYFYVNEEFDFESYIKHLIDIRKIYYSVRSQFSEKFFNESDYYQLYNNQRDSVNSIMPMIISEIEIEELEKIKKYAL